MGDIFTGSNTYLMYCDDLTNTSPKNTNFKQIKNLSTFPTFQQSSEVSKLETFDSEYSNVQLGSMNIEPITITVNYVLDEQVLDQYYDNGTEFQLMLCMEDSEDVLNYIILNGQITSTQIDGDKDTQLTKTYSFVTTDIQARGSVANTELYRGDFGVGSNGAEYPHNTTSVGNGFFLLDKNASNNSLGVDLIGTQTINNGKTSQMLITDTGTNPILRIRSNNGDLVKVYSSFEKPTLVELGAISLQELNTAIGDTKIYVSTNYYNKTQTDSTFVKITYVNDEFNEVKESVSELTESVTTINQTINDVKETVSELTESVSVLTDKVDTATESVSELTDKVDIATESVSELTESVSELDSNKINISGGTMTGLLNLFGDATSELGAVTKQQLDSTNAELKTYSDSTFATKTSLTDLRTYSDSIFATRIELSSGLANKLNLSGGTLTGPLILSGDATDPKGAVTKQQLDANSSGGIPLGMSWFHDSRTYLPEGTAAKDGQILSRALFPDMWQELADGKHPLVSDATWLADPSTRASFSSGDGSTTFRLPDWNGKSVGSWAAGVPRGDGLNSNTTVGTIQMDAFQNHAIGLSGTRNSGIFAYVGTGGTVGVNTIANTSAVTENLVLKDNGNDGVPRVAKETRMVNFTGVWVIKLAGGAMNTGQINALELATQITTLNSKVGVLEADAFTNTKMVNTPWINLTLGGGWTGSVYRYRKVLGMVQLQVSITKTPVTSGEVVATLPVGYRPTAITQTVVFAAFTSPSGGGATYPARIIFNTDGSMSLHQAGGGTELNFVFMFPIQ
ncbi:phage tail protein [Yersinia enterocolitica]